MARIPVFYVLFCVCNMSETWYYIVDLAGKRCRPLFEDQPSCLPMLLYIQVVD